MRTSQTRRLAEIEFQPSDESLPPDVAALINEARQRIETLEDRSRAAMPAFVPSDFVLVYQALAAVQSANLATGRRFLEWGSGIGVVACLATKLGFNSIGIEIEQPLVAIADELAAAYDLDAQFICGSFVPEGTNVTVGTADDFAWLSTTGEVAYDELDLQPDDFDLIFAYPWPGEEQIIFDLFADHAATGALLLTYHGIEGIRLHRKIKQ
jgi:predicted O-methyltransferase YrrM